MRLELHMKAIKKTVTHSNNTVPTQRKTKATMAALSLTFLAVLGVSLPSSQVYADIGATHTSLISEFASFNTPGVIDGRVEAIAIDGDTVFVGGTFTQIQDPFDGDIINQSYLCLLYTSPSPRDATLSRMPSSA